MKAKQLPRSASTIIEPTAESIKIQQKHSFTIHTAVHNIQMEPDFSFRLLPYFLRNRKMFHWRQCRAAVTLVQIAKQTNVQGKADTCITITGQLYLAS